MNKQEAVEKFCEMLDDGSTTSWDYNKELAKMQKDFLNRQIANQIKKLMNNKNISLEELSEESHINIKSLDSYLEGKLDFRNDILHNITRALDITIEELYNYNGNNVIRVCDLVNAMYKEYDLPIHYYIHDKDNNVYDNGYIAEIGLRNIVNEVKKMDFGLYANGKGKYVNIYIKEKEIKEKVNENSNTK